MTSILDKISWTDMMIEVNKTFVDTSGWAEFLVQKASYHLEAKRLLQQWHTQGTRVITTHYVLAELVALLTSPLKVPRTQQVNFIETLQMDEIFQDTRKLI